MRIWIDHDEAAHATRRTLSPTPDTDMLIAGEFRVLRPTTLLPADANRTNSVSGLAE
jgi:hypothetical protein